MVTRVDVVLDVDSRPVVVPCLVEGPNDIAVPLILDPEQAAVAADLAWEAACDMPEEREP